MLRNLLPGGEKQCERDWRKLNVDFDFVAKWTTCTTEILYAEVKSERGQPLTSSSLPENKQGFIDNWRQLWQSAGI